jgi:gliding motility-associated protein GldM
LSKGSKPGQYVMRPQQGTEVVINVTGKLPDGTTANDKKTFRIKSIPPPTGHVRGESGVVKGPASSLENSTVSAKILDFDFEVDVQVSGFNLKVTGQPTVVVQGNRMSPAAITAIKKAGRGDQVTISEIKTKLVGANIDLLKCSPVIYEIQ